MRVENTFSIKPLFAHGTDKGFCIGVRPHMPRQCAFIPEPTTTDGAGVRLVSARMVLAQVGRQVVLVAKTLIASIADERFLARVRAHVSDECNLLVEAPAARVAAEGLFARVDAQVTLQRAFMRKTLAAAFTLEGLAAQSPHHLLISWLGTVVRRVRLTAILSVSSSRAVPPVTHVREQNTIQISARVSQCMSRIKTLQMSVVTALGRWLGTWEGGRCCCSNALWRKWKDCNWR